MSPLIFTLLATLGTTLLVMLLLWLVATARKDVSLVDIYWGPGFIVVAGLAAALNRPIQLRMLVVLALVSVWGLRLAGFLCWRKWDEGEDRRYGAMRERHGHRFWWVSLGTVFLLQGVLLWTIAMPLQVVATSDTDSFGRLPDVAGLMLWAIGFFFEVVGDFQLARFKAKPENSGHVMNQGLWRFTRHPNYFGECLMWWGLYCMSFAASGGWTVFSPLLMTLLLLKISGVSLLESDITDRRPGYADYQRRTNAFIPWRPKA